MKIHCAHPQRSGQAVLEFALILPIFMLLLLAVIDFGRAYLHLHLLTNASREGARIASLPKKSEQDVKDTVNNFLQKAGLEPVAWPPSEIVVTDPAGNQKAGLADAEEGDRVRVKVQQDFAIIGVGIIPGIDGALPLDAVCTFRHE